MRSHSRGGRRSGGNVRAEYSQPRKTPSPGRRRCRKMRKAPSRAPMCCGRRYAGLQTKLNEVKAELRRRIDERIPEHGKWPQAVVGGHIGYIGVPVNQPALSIFRFQVGWLWHHSLSRRSQNDRVLGDRMRRLLTSLAGCPPAFCLSSLSSVSSVVHGRRYLRQEPDAGNPQNTVGDRLVGAEGLKLPSLHFRQPNDHTPVKPGLKK
jgi:hypothetical protein